MRHSSLARIALLTLALAGLGLSVFAGPAGAAQTGAARLHFFYAGGFELPALPAAAQTPPPVTNADGEPLVRWLLFYSTSCPHCHEVMENFLPGVYEKYGDQVEHRDIAIDQDDNYVTMLGLQTKLGLAEDQQGYVPALVIGDQVLVGGDQIPAQLEGLIDQYLAQGGVDYQSLEDLPAIVLPTPAPAVQTIIFYHPQDPGLQELQAFVGQLGARYGQGLQVIPFNRSEAQYAQVVEQLVTNLGASQPAPTEPVLLIDRQLLIGADAIEAELPGLVDRYLAEGGKSLPPLEELTAPVSPVTPTSTPLPASTGEPIYMAYFEKVGCQECARTTYDLQLLEEQYPQVEIERFAIEQEQALSQWLCEKYGVPENKWLSTPMIFVGDDVLLGSEATARNLLAAVVKYVPQGAPRTWDDFDEGAATDRLRDLFYKWGPLTIAGAGLIDGLNPCAFATLVLFISYMALTGRRGRDILFVGAAFALGVFFTYLLVGLGLSKIIQSIPNFELWGRWVYLLTALLCVVLAALTFRDYIRARRGQVSEMTLKLPLRLRRQINRVIREGAQMRAFVPVAFVTGFAVSLIELACTGQVYLPALMLMVNIADTAGRAFLLLILYCLAFIVPLVVVFCLSYFGTTSEQLSSFVSRHTITVKALTGVLFVALALWMAWVMAPLFGLQSPWNWMLMSIVLAAIALGVIATRPWIKPAPKKPSAARQARRRGSRA